jgi:quinol-cytochrome oxidoreductase complex cytochrome b subunit
LFVSIFFFVFYFVLRYLHSNPVRNPAGNVIVEPGNVSPIEQRIATLIGVVFALILLHTQQVEGALDQVLMFAGVFIVIFVIMLVGSIGKSSHAGAMWIVFAIILAVLILAFFVPQIMGIGEYFRTNCL